MSNKYSNFYKACAKHSRRFLYRTIKQYERIGQRNRLTGDALTNFMLTKIAISVAIHIKVKRNISNQIFQLATMPEDK